MDIIKVIVFKVKLDILVVCKVTVVVGKKEPLLVTGLEEGF